MRLPIVNDYTLAAELISGIAKICPTDKVNATLGSSSMYHRDCCSEEPKNHNTLMVLLILSYLNI